MTHHKNNTTDIQLKTVKSQRRNTNQISLYSQQKIFMNIYRMVGRGVLLFRAPSTNFVGVPNHPAFPLTLITALSYLV